MAIDHPDGTVPIAFTKADIKVPVDIQAQYITLDINIKAQTADVTINITAQSVGVYIQGEWTAKQGQQKFLYGPSSGLINPGYGETVITYAIPTGKTLFINSIGAAVQDDPMTHIAVDASIEGYVSNEDCSIFFVFAGRPGCFGSFPTPIRFDAGDTLYMAISNLGPDACFFGGSLGGWEI